LFLQWLLCPRVLHCRMCRLWLLLFHGVLDQLVWLLFRLHWICLFVLLLYRTVLLGMRWMLRMQQRLQWMWRECWVWRMQQRLRWMQWMWRMRCMRGVLALSQHSCLLGLVLEGSPPSHDRRRAHCTTSEWCYWNCSQWCAFYEPWDDTRLRQLPWARRSTSHVPLPSSAHLPHQQPGWFREQLLVAYEAVAGQGDSISSPWLGVGWMANLWAI